MEQSVKLSKVEIPLNLRVDKLERSILNRIDSTEKEIKRLEKTDTPDKGILLYSATQCLEIYKNIQQLPSDDKIAYDYKKYIFNNGSLREEDEVKVANEKLKKLRDEEIKNSDAYKQGYHPMLCFCLSYFILSLFGALIGCGSERSFYFAKFFLYFIASFILASPLWIIISLIITKIYCWIHADDFKTSCDLDLGKAFLVAGAGYIAGMTFSKHHFKSKPSKQNV